MASPNVLSKECKEALEALGRPLRFATSSDFSNLPKIRDLELTLHQMAKRALLLVSDSVVQAEITTFIAEIPSDSSSDFERKSALERLSERLERILTGEGAQISSSGQAPAAPTKADAQEDTSNVEPLFAPKKKKREVQTPLSPQRSKVKKSPVTKSARLDSPIQYLKGVGPRFAHLLDARGMKTVEDLLRFLPRRYERRLASSSISGLQEGTIATVEGVIATSGSRMMRGKRTLDVAIRDTTGVLQLRWFHAPGKAFHSRFKNGLTVRVSGRVSFFAGRSQMVHPEIHFVDENEAASDEPVETKQDEVVPVYSEIEGIRPALFRTIVERAMEAAPQLEECVPEYLRDAHRLPDLGESISALHFPPEGIDPVILEQRTSPWHRRLIYEELLLLQLTVLRRKVQTQSEKAQAIFFEDPLDELALELFSFELTQAQRRVLHDIQADLSREVPMQRLLQGDVGSGKTAVAFSAAAGVARAGLQTAIMAPTEILAEQHARSGLKALGEAGVRVALLTGATSTANRREILEQLASGEIQVIFGTHALIQSGVEYSRLGMVVVDEQHRFGVMQRAKLIELGKKSIGKAPHTLVMTATPIPRTLALTVYGDLDVSVLDELPPGRQTIATKVLTHHQRAQVYQRIRKAVAEGRQAYVVYPLVEESDKEAMQHVHDATSAAEELGNGFLSGIRVGLLHGRMSSDDKDRIMQSFDRGEIQVLISTTVVEVGVDVPNATVMVIEHAERFGLSQLHQLRGRVGRGEHKSQCLLVAYYTPSEEAARRLDTMEKTTDGFRIAEEDLDIRGPGDFMGTRQSGLPLLSVANLARDQGILMDARSDAKELLRLDPNLQKEEHHLLRTRMADLWDERLKLAQIG